jgi:hypothetical protein
MRALKRWRPSPATVLASIALFISLGGVSYGFATGSIDSREIKNNTVASKDIRNNQVTGRDIRRGGVFGSDIHNSSLTGTDVKNDSVTGRDILESSVGTVPTATTALNLQGLTPASFVPASKFVSTGSARKLSKGQTNVTVAKSGPFTITADCADQAPGAQLTLTATSTEANSAMNSTEGTTTTIDTVAGTTFNQNTNTNADLAAPSGASLDLVFQDGVNGIGTDCWVAGFGFS